ncbi:MAG: hypothetical protein HP054_02455 [Blautia sp.]|nr:hypothetical protein [Blautia sp.]
MATSITIDDVAMPEPKLNGLKITCNKIWSKNAGRGADGTMTGDIVALKWKLEIEFLPLTDAQMATLEKAVEPAFFNVTFRSPKTGKNITKKMYAGDLTCPVYTYVNGKPRYVGVTVSLIEK